MNTQSSESINIYEQRNCLNQLDDEIEKTIRELNSLNSQTMHQARAIQKKISNTRFVSPNQSFSLNAKASPNTSFTDSLDYRDIRNNPKNTKSGQLQLSPGDLIPRDDPLKELGYGSPDHQLMTDPKEYPFQQEQDFNQRVVLAQPFDFRSQNNDPKKQKNLGIVQKSSPPRKQLCRSEANTRESTYNSQAQHKENSILNTSQSRNSLHNLMEYHKLSNLDIPKERIHGQSRPEQFFGHQNNLRRKSGNQLERSPSASSVPSNSVVERLMNYGKQKEERLKMARNGGDLPRRVPYHVPKNAKPKLSKSYMGPDSDGSVFTTPVGSHHVIEHAFEEHSQSVTNFNASLKRNSVGSAEIIKQQIDQAGVGSHSEMNKEDVFYELYKEGYGAIPEVSEMAENATTKGELQNIINNMRDRVQRDQSPSNGGGGGLTKSKSQTKVNYDTKVSYGTLTKYKHVEPRYMNPTRDASKSPVAHAETEETPKPLFRPQLSKKSLEIASRLENSFQRLVDTSITKSKENKKKLIKKIDNEHTFQPKINKLSKALDERFKANVFNGDELHRWDQLYLMKEKYNMDKEARIRQKEEEEANNKECTFHPQISSNTYRMYRDNSTEFAERAKNWKHNKERRLDKEREYRFDKEMENCTFQPEVNENPNRFRNSSFSGSHNLNDISNLSIRGIDQHFEKIDKANRMKKELEARQERFSGKNWKSQITVPKEFLFHKREEPYGNYVRENIYGNAGESLEEKISKKVLFMERGRDLSPQAPPPRQRESFNNDSWMGHTNEFTMQQSTFEDAVVRLHYELQRMEF